jgi:hypothetical protein
MSFTVLLFYIMKGVNIFLQLRIKLKTAVEKTEKLYRENQIMKRRLLKYEKPGMLYYNNKRGLNENTSI